MPSRCRFAGLVPALVLSACGFQGSEPGKAASAPPACSAPVVPSGLAGAPGPGPVQASLQWQVSEGALRYRVWRDGKAFALLGNSLAFGDTGADAAHDYAVSAIAACGAESVPSATVNVTPLPGTLVEAPLTSTTAPRARLELYDVLDAKGNLIGQRTFRAVTGLGNCCETYVASDGAGRLYEYGGTNLFVSPDEGVTWSSVGNVVPAVNAEGAIVGAPGGDMLGVNWDAYSGDQVWSHKYVAATGKWYTSRTPLHQPFYDRPWVAVIKGPFDVDGVLVPYISFLMTNSETADVLMMSLDGLVYQLPDTHVLAQATTPVSLAMGPDPDRDWVQSMQESSIFPLDRGFGLRDRAVKSNCAQAVLTPTAEWMCPDWVGALLPPADGEVVRVDSAGAVHVTTASAGNGVILHRITQDGGKTWKSVKLRLPARYLVQDWDVQVNAALDQAVVVVHASTSTDDTRPDQDFVFRIAGLQGDPALKEILRIGAGDHVFGSSIAASSDRFDYTTVALLPSGHVALSFGDKRHVPPAVAVETDLPPDAVKDQPAPEPSLPIPNLPQPPT
ncbi:MAG TPA: hypothetical protein VM369_11905 [Candidatus Binatia bacterium]|nr:hypothetical protein [Candidatus Binatia bacterium]